MKIAKLTDVMSTPELMVRVLALSGLVMLYPESCSEEVIVILEREETSGADKSV